MAICSVCGKTNSTVDRYSFDGMCIDCTSRALSDENISKFAEKNNKILKNWGGK